MSELEKFNRVEINKFKIVSRVWKKQIFPKWLICSWVLISISIFIFFTPNVRHLRARVTVDHCFISLIYFLENLIYISILFNHVFILQVYLTHH